jgi:hypothetical protein
MPRLSQWMVRTALLWLGLGFTTGSLVLIQKGVPVATWLWALRMSHVWMLLVGWVVQLGIGVAYWIFPRFDAAGDRGSARWWWLGYILLNGGVFAAALRDPAALLWPATQGPMAVLAGVLLGGAAALLIPQVWRRVLPFRLLTR